jgi:type 1 fimbria pilin
LNLSADTSAAKGVALQLLYNDQPLPLSSRVKWQTTAADGNYAIPLKARYLQTDASVTPGVANAAATFTVTYQ